MAVTRANILKSTSARQNYIKGVLLLKNEFTGPTTASFGIPGPTRKVSTYDLFVVWHHVAMSTMTPPSQSDRNAAHRGPAFLPWHRFMLRQLELNLQRVLNDPNFGLPYWDWAADGQKPPAQQPTSKIWGATCMGGNGVPITTGPFVFNSALPKSFRVRIEANVNGVLQQANRGLRRSFQTNAPSLPKKADTAGVLTMTPYDSAPWSRNSTSFRNRVEGWQGPNAPALHNLVHVCVGGDMLPSSSPNDPVFFLNHCNEDRIWEAWMQQNGRNYAPPASAPASLNGHRFSDQLNSMISASQTIASMLNMTVDYVYDSLSV